MLNVSSEQAKRAASFPRLGAFLIAHNEEAKIAEAIQSLSFCDDVVVIDSESTDQTRVVAERAGARVIVHAFSGFGAQKEFGRSQVRGDWVINLDADERLSLALREELVALLATDPDHVAYSVPFRNRFRGRWLRHGGYSPDRHVRIFKKNCASFVPREKVHESLHVRGSVGILSGHIDHYTYDSVAHFLEKSAAYGRLFADQHLHSGAERLFSMFS